MNLGVVIICIAVSRGYRKQGMDDAQVPDATRTSGPGVYLLGSQDLGPPSTAESTGALLTSREPV